MSIICGPGKRVVHDGRKMELAVRVEKEKFKFNCAHFVAFKGFRERLHGHNYQVGVTMQGALGADGYVLDFGVVKRHAHKVCKEWNEHLICPMDSDVLEMDASDGVNMRIRCEDGAEFSVPLGDCLCLPIRHSTAEELARVFFDKLIESLTLEYLQVRKVTMVTITVSETPNQQAIYRRPLVLPPDAALPPVAPPQPCLPDPSDDDDDEEE